MSQLPQLNVRNQNGFLKFDGNGKFSCSSTSTYLNSLGTFTIQADDDTIINTTSGNTYIINDSGSLIISALSNVANSLIISAVSANGAGGFEINTGSGGISLTSNNGDISLESNNANTFIGTGNTQNIYIDAVNNIDMTSGDFSLIVDDVINIISNTGDINIGSDPLNPVIKFQDGNLLVNQASSDLDYQVDVNLSDSSNSNPGYNGIVVKSNVASVASETTMRTTDSNTIVSLGVQPLSSNHSIYQNYLAYQSGSNIIIINDANFNHTDVGKNIYWNTTQRRDTITGLSSLIIGNNDPSNLTVSGTYTGNISKFFLLQIDTLGNGISSNINTFKWSVDGGTTFANTFVPVSNTSPTYLTDGISVQFAQSNGYPVSTQFTFYGKVTAVPAINTNIDNPETLSVLQPYFAYLKTETPTDLVISTNDEEKMRITGDGAIGIQTNHPDAGFHVNSKYGDILLTNEITDGYQINPAITSLVSGGYVITWASKITGGTYDIYAQRYMADGSKYQNNFLVSQSTSLSQIFPAIANNRSHNSDHYIVVWASNHDSGIDYDIYCQIYHNNQPISPNDILVNEIPISPTPDNDEIYPRVSGLVNGNYIITWASDDGTGKYNVYGRLINDSGSFVNSQTLLNQSSPYSKNYPWVTGLSETDPAYPGGFVVSYLSELATDDDRYKVVFRSFNANCTTTANEVLVTTTSNASNVFTSISDGLQSMDYIPGGDFMLSFYQNYDPNNSLYLAGDGVTGVSSGGSGTLGPLQPNPKNIIIYSTGLPFILGEEINILSGLGYGQITQRIQNITYLNDAKSNLYVTLDTGHQNVLAYRFRSNATTMSGPEYFTTINTSVLYSDSERYNTSISNSSIFAYNRPMSSISVDGNNTALVAWTNGSIPNIYYQLINITNGSKIYNETLLTDQYLGLKRRNQMVTYLTSINGDDYGYVMSWDNQNLDLSESGIYNLLIGYKHDIIRCNDADHPLVWDHRGYAGLNTTQPDTSLHLVNNPDQNCIIKIQSYLPQITATDQINNLTVVDNSLPAIESINPRYTADPRYIKQGIIFSNAQNTTLAQMTAGYSPSYQSLAPLPENLIGYFTMDELADLFCINYAPRNTDGNRKSLFYLQDFDLEICRQPGLINSGLIFDGVTNYCYYLPDSAIDLNTQIEGNGELSTSIWIKVPSNVTVGSNYTIFTNSANLEVGATYIMNLIDYANDGNMCLATTITSNATSNITVVKDDLFLNDNNWHQIGFTLTKDTTTFTNNILKLYIDGVQQTSNTFAGQFSSSIHTNDYVYLGSSNGNANFYRGMMDEFRIYNCELTPAQMNLIYQYGANIAGGIYWNTRPIDSTGMLYTTTLTLDDHGDLMNLTCRPRNSNIYDGLLTQYNANNAITSNNANFTSNFKVGDILQVENGKFTVTAIPSDTTAILSNPPTNSVDAGYYGPVIYPAVQYWKSEDEIHLGHMDYYGRVCLGIGQPASKFEIIGDNASTSLPYITLTNNVSNNSVYNKSTGVRFRGNVDNDYDTLGLIKVSYNGSNTNSGIMQFKIGQTEYDAMSITSNGYIGMGNQNDPKARLHFREENTSIPAQILLESSYNSLGNTAKFSEQSDIYFGGTSSLQESFQSLNANCLAKISGSNDGTELLVDGRIDFYTNNSDDNLGLQNRMTINKNGYIGMDIIQPSYLVEIAPEQKLSPVTITTVSGITPGSPTSVITLTNNVFNGLSNDEMLRFRDGCVIFNNDDLNRYTIESVTQTPSTTVTVLGNVSASFVSDTISVHYPGLRVTSNGKVGIGTKTITSQLNVVGSQSASIKTITSNTTLGVYDYTILANASASVIGVALPASNNITGRLYNIKKIDSSGNQVYIIPNGSEQIDSSGSYNLTTQNQFVRLQTDGSNWWSI